MKNLPRYFSSIFLVNLLYLLTIILNLLLGSWIQSIHFIWGLIASEVLLFLLPTIAFLRLRHIPLKEGLRLKPIRPLTGVLCVLLGFATYLFVVIIDATMARLITIPGMAVSIESIMPKGMLESIGLFLALTVVAPLCEEPLFRGVIQAAYEKQRAISSAIAIVALMFAFWHFQLSGLTSLLLEACIFGYLVWRTKSIYSSVLMHFGLNATSGTNLLLSLNTGKGLPFLGLPAAAVGLIVTILLVYAIRRLTPEKEQPAALQPVQTHSRLLDYSPLVVVGLIFLVIIGQIFTTGKITLSQAGYNKVQIDQVLESRFQITDEAKDNLGEMDCKLIPQGSNIHLDCTGEVRAYEIPGNSGVIKDAAHLITWAATWNTDSMGLLDFSYERIYQEAGSNFRAALKNGQLVVDNSAGKQEITLSPGDLVEYEWAWRVNALKPQVFTSIQAPFAYLLWWDEQAGKWHPALLTEALQLARYEALDLPAGQVQAHKASVGGQSAWYTDDHAGPVRFDDGTLIYELEK